MTEILPSPEMQGSSLDSEIENSSSSSCNDESLTNFKIKCNIIGKEDCELFQDLDERSPDEYFINRQKSEFTHEDDPFNFKSERQPFMLFQNMHIGKAEWDTGDKLMSSKYLGATLLNPNDDLEANLHMDCGNNDQLEELLGLKKPEKPESAKKLIEPQIKTKKPTQEIQEEQKEEIVKIREERKELPEITEEKECPSLLLTEGTPEFELDLDNLGSDEPWRNEEFQFNSCDYKITTPIKDVLDDTEQTPKKRDLKNLQKLNEYQEIAEPNTLEKTPTEKYLPEDDLNVDKISCREDSLHGQNGDTSDLDSLKNEEAPIIVKIERDVSTSAKKQPLKKILKKPEDPSKKSKAIFNILKKEGKTKKKTKKVHFTFKGIEKGSSKKKVAKEKPPKAKLQPNKQPKKEETTIDVNYEISEQGYERLKNNQWLNDEVINAFIQLINKELAAGRYLTREVTFLQTYACPIILGLDPEKYEKKISKLFKKVDLKKQRWIYIPVHYQESHWLLILVDAKDKKFIIVDSMKSLSFPKRYEIVKNIKRFFEIKSKNDELYPSAKKKATKKWGLWYRTCTQQPNDYDCGVFLCLNMMILSCNLLKSIYSKIYFPANKSDEYREFICQSLQNKELRRDFKDIIHG
ncbi:unnamed protein product [Moneuplotes crassus]|uniref:Ubiquitin-like protease family profile domain-containing protein n=1 Tax=Euplotes crassus TaxID=5936 RepID=A0AAD1U2C8_EUPCR|nr:unnamed protein product [Moneuplotes crassus]